MKIYSKKTSRGDTAARRKKEVLGIEKVLLKHRQNPVKREERLFFTFFPFLCSFVSGWAKKNP
jgi:hypothetical protein